MKQEDFEKLQNTMSTKLGQDNFALITDELATMMTDNNLMNTQITDANKQIDKLKQDKQNLLETNGNLMQKITMGFDDNFVKKKEQETEVKKYNINDAFDEKGNFK